MSSRISRKGKKDGSPGITVAIVTLSDKGARGKRKDMSGPLIARIIRGIGAVTVSYDIIPDDRKLIRKKLLSLCDRVDLILTTGGTGLSPRDVTPEVTREIITREIPGIPEAMRLEGLRKTPHAMISRAVAGVRGSTLIINLPGSSLAVEESLAVVMPCLPHAVEKIKGSMKECARIG